MSEKYFEKLSSAFLAHYCRRLSDLIIEQGSEILREMQLIAPSTAISTMIFLKKNGGVSIAVLAEALGVSHQMATQRINSLQKLGLIERIADAEDKRAKKLSLTQLGQTEVSRLEPFTKKINRVFDELEAEVGCELMSIIRQTELALIKKPLKQRLSNKRSK